MQKSEIISLLEQRFEKELAVEIAENQIFDIPAKTFFGDKNSIKEIQKAEFIPLILEGNIRVVRYDQHQNEILIYNICSLQSCIVTINAYIRDENLIDAVSYTTENTKLLMVSTVKIDSWFAKYKTWRDFVFSLYDLRIKELLEQHEIISNQNSELVHQKKEITDSIHYARRIQTAVLPPQNFISKHIPNHFIIFKPRDIVSGDYYWISHRNDKTFVVVADCTGHGVPGAFMSMLGITSLNLLSEKLDTFSAGEILDNMRDYIKNSLRQTDDNQENRDGMDMALFILDDKTNLLQYAGAYNPLYVIRNNHVIELKPDKMPVGIHYRANDFFATQTLQLQKNDRLYAFSDGYASQFGGENNSKFMTRNFKKLIFDNHQKTMTEQKEILELTLENWKGNRKQIDDILVMGIEISN